MMFLRRFAEGPARKRVTVLTIRELKQRHVPITMCTAYSYPQALHVDSAGMDMILVGDSLGMVELGHKDTIPVTMDDMVHHSSAVRRGTQRSLVVADMPFGSYGNATSAYSAAVRLFKECAVDAVKLEGGREVAGIVRHLVERGMSVMGHVGLTPQSSSVLGGFRVQGKSSSGALRIVEDAVALERAGCFSIVAECVPSIVATRLSGLLSIPVLVYHDLLGVIPGYRRPSFSKSFAEVSDVVRVALERYQAEVRDRSFPAEHQNFPMPAGEEERFLADLEQWTRENSVLPEAGGGGGEEGSASGGSSSTITLY